MINGIMTNYLKIAMDFYHTAKYTPVSSCDRKPCKNKGLCRNIGDSYVCKCQGGYTGRNCEIGK